MMLAASGDVPSSESVEAVDLSEEFGTYTTISLLGDGRFSKQFFATAQGADGSHPLWRPAIDGLQGFNYLITLGETVLAKQGRYRLRYTAEINGVLTQSQDITILVRD